MKVIRATLSLTYLSPIYKLPKLHADINLSNVNLMDKFFYISTLVNTNVLRYKLNGIPIEYKIQHNF